MPRQQVSRRRALWAGAGTGLALAVGTVATTHEATAQTPPVSSPRESLTWAASQVLLAAGEAKARELGVPMVMALVDESGVLKAFARMDGTALVSVELAQAKAYTAAAFRTPTHLIAAANQADPVRLASLSEIPRVTLLGGGYPIRSGTTVVGGFGAGGGTPQQDMEVAEAALAAFG